MLPATRKAAQPPTVVAEYPRAHRQHKWMLIAGCSRPMMRTIVLGIMLGAGCSEPGQVDHRDLADAGPDATTLNSDGSQDAERPDDDGGPDCCDCENECPSTAPVC